MRIARFRTALTSEGALCVRATAVIDGLGSSELPAEVVAPVVLGWEKPDGTHVAGEQCLLEALGDYFFDIAFMGQYAVVPSCEVVSG